MKASRTLNIFFVFATLILGTLTANAQPHTFIEGVHYTILDSSTLRKENTSEVLEVFWYGCPHCYAFEPLLDDWKSSLDSDTKFSRSPVIFSEIAKQHALLYFVAETLGITETIHSEIFTAIQEKGNYLLNEDDAKEFFVEFGVSGEQFDKAYKSFNVISNLRKAESMQKNAGIQTVPALIVNQTYLVNMNRVVNLQEALDVVDYLITMDEQQNL